LRTRSEPNWVTSWILELEARRTDVFRLQTVIRLCRPLQRSLTPGGEQLVCAKEAGGGRDFDTVVKPLLHNVLIAEVGFRRLCDGFGRLKSDPTPLATAIKRPTENCRPFRL